MTGAELNALAEANRLASEQETVRRMGRKPERKPDDVDARVEDMERRELGRLRCDMLRVVEKAMDALHALRAEVLAARAETRAARQEAENARDLLKQEQERRRRWCARALKAEGELAAAAQEGGAS